MRVNNLLLLVSFFVLIMSLAAVELALGQTPSVQEDPPAGASIVFTPTSPDQTGFLNVELNPGEQESLALAIGNDGDEPIRVVTYAADAYSLRNGGFGIRELSDEKTGPTLWLDYDTEEIAIRPNEILERNVTIKVPEGTVPGEYVAGLIVQGIDDNPTSEGDALADLNFVYRTAMGVRIVVPGDLQPELEIGIPWFHNDQITYAIVVPVKNTGNLQTSPAGTLSIWDTDGDLLVTLPVEMGRIYGGHETELRVGLAAPLPNGEYEIVLNLGDESKDLHVDSPRTSMLVTGTEDDLQAEQSPITFTSSTVEPMPAADNVQFLAVDATITNTTEEPIANAQLSLIATVDGEEVERFPVSQSLSVPPGDTDVSTRYIPLTGWNSGEWEFELLLETVEGSGAAVVVDRVTIETKVTIP